MKYLQRFKIHSELTQYILKSTQYELSGALCGLACHASGGGRARSRCDPEDPQRDAGATAAQADEPLAAEECVLPSPATHAIWTQLKAGEFLHRG